MTDPDLRARELASFAALLEAESDEGQPTCICGTPGIDYDGPDEECPIHGRRPVDLDYPFDVEILTLADLGWTEVRWVGGDLALSSVDALMLVQLTPSNELVSTLYEQITLSEHDWVERLLGIAAAQDRPTDNKRFSIVAWRDRVGDWHLPR